MIFGYSWSERLAFSRQNVPGLEYRAKILPSPGHGGRLMLFSRAQDCFRMALNHFSPTSITRFAHSFEHPGWWNAQNETSFPKSRNGG
jgi:hypothetical protein